MMINTDIFDLEKITFAYNYLRKNTSLNFSLHPFDTVDSTNKIAWQLAEQGAEIGTTVIARQQNSGRGQWGRTWNSAPGGLYLSMLIYQNSSPQSLTPLAATDSYQLTLATAWGIANQLQDCGIPIELKWPNDLILQDRKLGGILTETRVIGQQISRAVVGVGINWQNPTPETGINLRDWLKLNPSDRHTQDLPKNNSSKIQINSLEALIGQVLQGIETGLACLFNEGVSILLPRYLKFFRNMGEQVYVNNSLGTIVGVTPTGCLHVRMATCESKSVNLREIYLSPGTISLGYGRPAD